MAPARERISGVDTAWLRMEHPTNLMMIVGVLMFDQKLDLKAVKRTLTQRFLAFRRFRQRAVQEATGAWWEEDAGFDIDAHVLRVRLPGRAEKAELETLASALASTPLDFSKPLWQFHLVENYARGSALIMRIHHCYADGMALVQVMLSMTDATAQGSLHHEPGLPVPEPAAADGALWERVLRPVTGALERATSLSKGLLDRGRGLAANPEMAAGVAQEFARKGMDFAGEVARIALMGRDSQTRFKGSLGTRKRAAWAEPLPLDEVKVMGRALGCSINDVLLSMAAGALRDYLEEHGDPVDGIEIRAVVPVNLRAPGTGAGLGNQFGFVFLDLPVGIDHPLERLYEVRRRMSALKGSYQPIIALGLLGAVGYGPRAVQDQVLNLLGQNSSVVMTNVPGPTHPLYFAGRHIAELDFWVPQSGGIGMGVSILSYDGRIQFGVITDAGLVPDPDAIVGRFAAEFEKLMWLTLMSPWGEEPATPDSPRDSPAPPPAKAPDSAPIPKRFRNL